MHIGTFHIHVQGNSFFDIYIILQLTTLRFHAAFADRFASGTHKLEVRFSDLGVTASGYADIYVSRTTGSGTPPPDINSPLTGDTFAQTALLVTAVISLLGIGLFLIVRFRRRARARKA